MRTLKPVAGDKTELRWRPSGRHQDGCLRSHWPGSVRICSPLTPATS